jgi:hypothetical protein
MHFQNSRIDLVPKIYRRPMPGANKSARRIQRGASSSGARAAYGILQFIMRHTYVLIAILGVCFAAAGQAAKQQPKPPAAAAASPAQPQPPSDEELMAKTAEATIDWDKKTTPGAKVDVLLIKKDQVNDRPVMQYHVKVTGAPKNKFYTLMAWPITLAAPVIMVNGLVIAPDGTVGCPPDSTKSCAQSMKGAELKLTYTPGIGEIYRHTLVSEDHTTRIFFSIVPAPMVEQDKGCSLEIVRLSPRFELALIRGKGFTPGEVLNFHSQSYQEVHNLQTKVNPQGEFWATLTPFVQARKMGTTEVVVKGKSCAPTLSFEWGSE